MRATTIKASGPEVAKVIGYYAGLADDQLRRDGRSRGPVDYYVDPHEPPGQWWGDGCEAVDLAGEVRPEQLTALLEGRHPGTGHKLGKKFGSHSARAFDLTFSTPKSVSVLWALAPESWMRDEIVGAQDAAVIATMGWVQQLGAVTRRGTKGIQKSTPGAWWWRCSASTPAARLTPTCTPTHSPGPRCRTASVKRAGRTETPRIELYLDRRQ